jgi:hypothetical protein
MGELFQQGNQRKKELGIEPPPRQFQRVHLRRIRPIGPLPRDAEGATIQPAKNESVIASDASLFEYWKALTAQRMIRVTDLGPSQMLTVLQCSLR